MTLRITALNTECCYAECRRQAIMVGVVRLSVVMLSVVAPAVRATVQSTFLRCLRYLHKINITIVLILPKFAPRFVKYHPSVACNINILQL
jgi:hypothetical protein